MINKTEVVALETRLICDDCGGAMRFIGSVSMTEPPRYLHQCLTCGKQAYDGSVYPSITYRHNRVFYSDVVPVATIILLLVTIAAQLARVWY